MVKLKKYKYILKQNSIEIINKDYYFEKEKKQLKLFLGNEEIFFSLEKDNLKVTNKINKKIVSILFLNKVFSYYEKFLENKNLKINILNSNFTVLNNFKSISITFEIDNIKSNIEIKET